jgi:hypothetical protein
LDNKGPKSNFSCLKCRHYYVTYDPRYPRGCHRYGMQTKAFPSDVVKRESGEDCLSFEDKNAKKNAKSLEDRWKWE